MNNQTPIRVYRTYAIPVAPRLDRYNNQDDEYIQPIPFVMDLEVPQLQRQQTIDYSLCSFDDDEKKS